MIEPYAPRQFAKIGREALKVKMHPLYRLVWIDLLVTTRRGPAAASMVERSERLEISRPTMIEAERWLEANGYLEIIRQPGRPSIYHAGLPTCKPALQVSDLSPQLTPPVIQADTPCNPTLQARARDPLTHSESTERREDCAPEVAPLVLTAEEAPKEKPKRKAPDTPITRMIKALEEAQGYEAARPGMEAKAAKRILDMGYTQEQAIACRNFLATDPWFDDKGGVTLQIVASRIGAWEKSETSRNGRAPAVNGRGPEQRETMAEAHERLMKSLRERNATGRSGIEGLTTVREGAGEPEAG